MNHNCLVKDAGNFLLTRSVCAWRELFEMLAICFILWRMQLVHDAIQDMFFVWSGSGAPVFWHAGSDAPVLTLWYLTQAIATLTFWHCYDSLSSWPMLNAVPSGPASWMRRGSKLGLHFGFRCRHNSKLDLCFGIKRRHNPKLGLHFGSRCRRRRTPS